GTWSLSWPAIFLAILSSALVVAGTYRSGGCSPVVRFDRPAEAGLTSHLFTRQNTAACIRLAPHDPEQLLSTCPNSRSTGTARPKIETSTLRRARSSSTSWTKPLNEANGPSDTRTCSPISKVTDGFGRSTPSCT